MDATNAIVGYGSARLLSIATYPAFSPIYCDNEQVFLKLITEILGCFPEEMAEKKQVGIWVPSTNIPKLKAITAGICSFEEVCFFGTVSFFVFASLTLFKQYFDSCLVWFSFIFFFFWFLFHLKSFQYIFYRIFSPAIPIETCF